MRPRRTLRRIREAILTDPLLNEAPARVRDSSDVVARRRRVVAGVSVAGAGLLGLALATPPGSRRFYALTLTTAGAWTVGGLLSGPLHLGRVGSPETGLRRPVILPVATGVGAFGVFYGFALVARRIPILDGAISQVLQFADRGATPLVVLSAAANGVAEEVFFRGALYSAIGPPRAATVTTAVYTAATLSTRNPALVLAAGVMGSLFALERRATGGIQASALTHVVWSVLMLRYLPPMFRREGHDHAEL